MNSKTKQELNLFWLMHGNRKLVVRDLVSEENEIKVMESDRQHCPV